MIKTTSAKILAFYISLIVTGISLALTIVVDIYKITPILYILFFVCLLFVVYYILTHIITSFVYRKISPVYKLINEKHISDREILRKLRNRDIITVTKDEFSNKEDKKIEIIHNLRQQAKYRKEFIGNVSHELKTPIFNIQGYVLTLLDGGLEDKDINRLYLEKSEKSINRMISIVNDLEQISKLESGDLKLRKEKFDIIELIKDVFELQEYRAKKKNIELKLNIDDYREILVFADRHEVTKVLDNLIVNSIKYGKEGGITKVGIMDIDKQIVIEITDNGIGIERDDLPRIFERFFRVDKSRSRKIGGTGLGLAIVKHIINAHDQTINVRSRINKGTSFTFTLEKTK